MNRTVTRIVMVMVLASAASCAGQGVQVQGTTFPKVSELRKMGPTTTDGERIGQWLISELISPGADAKRAAKARERLAQSKSTGLFASLARGMDADAHGHPTRASEGFLKALEAARDSRDPIAPLAAWYVADRLYSGDAGATTLWSKASKLVTALIDRPGSIGWRARALLVQWWARQQQRQAKGNLLDRVADKHGCARHVMLAGPFGHGSVADSWTSFAPERPGRWPQMFTPDPLRTEVTPKILETERYGCSISAKNAVAGGVFYAQTFFSLKNPRQVLLSVQGARAIWVDDVEVLTRDRRQWGSWANFGVLLRLSPGRHRVTAKLMSSRTSIRIGNPNGTPLGVTTSSDDATPYDTDRPQVLANPNELSRFVSGGELTRPQDDLTAFLAAHLAHEEGLDDVGSVLMEPLVKKIEVAGPLALEQQTHLLSRDPAFPADEAENLSRDLHKQVAKKDPGCWQSMDWLIVDKANKGGLSTTTKKLEKLMDAFPEEPTIGTQLRQVYGRLGWSVQQTKLAEKMVKRFPENVSVLEDAMAAYDAVGNFKQADLLAERILHLRPDSAVLLDRALSRGNYQGAIDELTKLAKLRPERKSTADRIKALMLRAGLKRESMHDLEEALRKAPKSSSARLALADARYANGDLGALRQAITEALEKGASIVDLENAVEVLEGRTELAPYRLDGKKIIQAYEHNGAKMDASAVRVLDYGVTWVRRNGSTRMLEHEIVRVQSQEAIGKLSEQRVPRGGLLLQVRVIKKDGRVMEPEYVADKPTLTMPHLEVGDYIETEWITNHGGDWHDGRSYVGPHWFFREQDIAYWRSEFVLISPKDRKLQIEIQGDVPRAKVHEDGPLVIHRWRVDHSQAAVLEPGAVSVRERLPNVRVGWGISLQQRLESLVDRFVDPSATDPRLVRIAEGIVRGIPESQTNKRVRRVYRWLLANVQRGSERDGRRVIVGRSGQLVWGFLYLTKVLGIETQIAVVRDGLAPTPLGPISEAEQYRNYVLRVNTDKEPVWLTVSNRFTPFGYIPAQLRGQPGFLLTKGTPKITTSSGGALDGLINDVTGTLRKTGSATLQISRRFTGKYAISIRRTLDRIEEAQQRNAFEGLIAKDLPGAALTDLDIQDRQDLDKPLTVKLTVEAPDFTRRDGTALLLTPPFQEHLNKLATLPSRKTTLLLSDAYHAEVHLKIALPNGAKVSTPLKPVKLSQGRATVTVNDHIEDNTLVLDRVIDLPAGRVKPTDYADFQAFCRNGDDAMQREIRIQLR